MSPDAIVPDHRPRLPDSCSADSLHASKCKPRARESWRHSSSKTHNEAAILHGNSRSDRLALLTEIDELLEEAVVALTKEARACAEELEAGGYYEARQADEDETATDELDDEAEQDEDEDEDDGGEEEEGIDFCDPVQGEEEREEEEECDEPEQGNQGEINMAISSAKSTKQHRRPKTVNSFGATSINSESCIKNPANLDGGRPEEDSQFYRLEQIRDELESQLGTEKLISAYSLIQGFPCLAGTFVTNASPPGLKSPASRILCERFLLANFPEERQNTIVGRSLLQTKMGFCDIFE
ncbi:unnamed protein product [Protopolystoma xenopodis]|uniref:Uncharacterized protein n=1 Tax=Protopolystoma xenopodis TaxID=117903 RepID=A0A448WDB8_9PLAT|nr:unnamed protein product [Protopolystoma xenopodis]